MATSLLEQYRAFHEDIERAERLIAKDLKQEVKGHKNKLYQDHRVRLFCDLIRDRAQRLIHFYQDEDSSRKEEIQFIGGGSYVTFYDKVRELRSYHKDHTRQGMDITEVEKTDKLLKLEPQVQFTGEEVMGRYLDLHEHYLKYINSSFGQQIEYYQYVSSFIDVDMIDRRQKLTSQYRNYLQDLIQYLGLFHERTKPLVEMDKMFKALDVEFQRFWAQGQIPGWEDKGGGIYLEENEERHQLIDLDMYQSAEELESLSGETLKEALKALGCKCGGTVQQRAERLFSTKGKQPSEFDPNILIQSKEKKGRSDMAKQTKMAYQIAWLEVKMKKLCETLLPQIKATKGHVEKKLAQADGELMEDVDEDIEVEEESEEEDDYIYNPLKLPLGWDGKPIPYWLYKLHGLNQEFKCEICGNYSYWGRRAFEKHFKEWRHQNGMRALGIPNSKQFYEITKIEDALALWESIRERETGHWKQEVDEEYEDRDGNVYNKKTYDDLRSQGLI
eukprot:TRINITY_DN6271_c0_g1_i3.p1 TRINITY_DN6271_c0_g1~~TRINITY_DN6271_c0_g1_i3.p1  ORF type:complete len:512 (-),score=69.91 TRINITY_DN6271_c0_g1_i3:269-1774(-)